MDAVKIALAENDVLKRWELRKGRASSETHYEFNRPNRRINSVLVSLMIKSPSIKFAVYLWYSESYRNFSYFLGNAFGKGTLNTKWC
jgi:hypothetical protein